MLVGWIYYRIERQHSAKFYGQDFKEIDKYLLTFF